MKYIGEVITCFVVVCLLILAIMGAGSLISRINTPPVEERINIDSILKTNDSIKIKVEHLDSIKNAKVIEVISLNNDSTLKLFYQLVTE